MGVLDPDRTLAILVGASSWPRLLHFESAKAFRHTADEVRAYFGSPRGLGLDATHLLDLFDSDASSTALYEQIKTFVQHHLNRLDSRSGNQLVVFFWYVGHGALLGPDKDYCLLIRGTDPFYAPESSLRVSAIADLLRQLVPSSSRIVVLDCCHAGQAATKFQGGFEEAMALQTEHAFEGGSGVAILAASSAKSPAQLATADTWTLFGRALLDALNQGDPSYGAAMSLRDVRELVLQALVSGPVDHPPKPEVHCPNQKDRDLGGVPLFPNPAAPAPETSVPADRMPVPLLDPKDFVSSLTTVEPVAPVASETDEQLQRLVLTGNPTTAFAAAQRLAERHGPTELITSEFTRRSPTALWRLYVAREALKADPHAAAAAILPLARKAHHDWHAARSAVNLLSPALHDEVVQEMARTLRESSDFDNERVAIEALGRVGAGEYANLVVAAAGSPDQYYQWEKLGRFVPVALARMARLEDRTVSLGAASQPGSIETLAKFMEQYGTDPHLAVAFQKATAEVQRMGPEHADYVIEYWLNADNRELVALGATTLGHMRLLRGRQPLIERLQGWGDLADPVAATMVEELARIGGSVAYEWLIEHIDGRHLYRSLALCLDDAPEEDFEKIVPILIHDSFPGLSWWAYRAIGKRPLPVLLPELNAALSSAEPVDRGVGAIALARARGASVTGQLRSAVAESSGRHERALTTLALLIATRDPDLVEELEEPLAEECWLWETVLFEDVVYVLESWGGRRGAEIAQTLRWIASASDPAWP